MLYNGDCLDILSVPDWKINGIFADPPDNLGLEYVGSSDRRSDYYQWICRIIQLSLSHCDTFWLSYYFRHDLEISKMIPFGVPWRKIIWRFTFGQYRETDLPNGFRYILRLGEPGRIGDVRIESERMKLGDKRAKGPRILDDVWEVPRVVGNSSDRCHWHPTQHPRLIYSRIHRYTNPLMDIFCGSGTGFHVGMEYGIELSHFYCQKIIESGIAKAVSKEEFIGALSRPNKSTLLENRSFGTVTQ